MDDVTSQPTERMLNNDATEYPTSVSAVTEATAPTESLHQHLHRHSGESTPPPVIPAHLQSIATPNVPQPTSDDLELSTDSIHQTAASATVRALNQSTPGQAPTTSADTHDTSSLQPRVATSTGIPSVSLAAIQFADILHPASLPAMVDLLSDFTPQHASQTPPPARGGPNADDILLETPANTSAAVSTAIGSLHISEAAPQMPAQETTSALLQITLNDPLSTHLLASVPESPNHPPTAATTFSLQTPGDTRAPVSSFPPPSFPVPIPISSPSTPAPETLNDPLSTGAPANPRLSTTTVTLSLPTSEDTPDRASTFATVTPQLTPANLPLPAPAPAPSQATTNTLISHSFESDNILPTSGRVIKIKFPSPIPGPGSALHTSAVSTSAPSSSNKYNYHSALVVNAANDYINRSFTVKAYPIPAFSGEDFATALNTLGPEEQQYYIPIPPADTRDTPVAFGNPVTPTTLDENGNTIPYKDRIPSWLVMRPMAFNYPRKKTWKEFRIPVTFSFDDVVRIERYEYSLRFPALLTQDQNINMYREPGPSPEVLQLFHSLGQDTVVLFDDDDDSDGYTENDDADEPISRMDLYRMLARPEGDDWMRRKVEEVDEKERKGREERTVWWVRQMRYVGSDTTGTSEGGTEVEGSMTPDECENVTTAIEGDCTFDDREADMDEGVS